MKKMVGILSQVFCTLWIIVVVFFYFFNSIGGEITWRASHQYYIDSIRSLLTGSRGGGLHPLVFILVVIGIEYLLFYLWRRFHAGEKKIDIHLSPFSLLILFSVFFFVIAFGWFVFYHVAPAIYLAPYAGIFTHYGFIIVCLGFILLLCASLGKYVLQYMKRDESYDLKEFLLSFGLGAVLLTLILFICGLFGWLQSIPVWGICIASLIISYKELWQWLKSFFKPQIHFQGSYVDVRIILFFIFLIVLSHNVLELIRPIPIGFDDLAVYMNVPNLLARGGRLLSGIDACSWGIFMSLGFLLFHSTTIALFLSFLGGVLAFFGLYISVQSYCEQRDMNRSQANTYALFMATLFYTLPTIVFQSAKDMKVDLAAFFFMLLSFILFMAWRKKDQGDVKSLWLSGLFMGFAFTIKYTALFFIVALLLYALLSMWRRQQKNAAVTIFVFIICIGVPFAPYAIKNIAETQQISIQSLRTGKIEAPWISLNPPLAGLNGQLPAPTPTGVQEEQGRYAGFDQGIRKYLMLPLTVTFNPIAFGMYVDIGYIFLALIPLAIILYIRTHEGGHSLPLLYEILFVGGIYWILWGIFAQGVIWYGYGGFIFLFLLIVEIIHHLKKEYWTGLRYAVNICIIVWFLCTLCLRTASLPSYGIFIDPVGLAYARGVIDEQGYWKQKIPAYLTILKIINSDIAMNKENPPKTYRVGTFIKYFIHHNNKLVLDDNQLDVFMFLSQDHDDQKTIARFKNAGFKYLIIDANTATIDNTPGKTLTAKYQALTHFIQQNPKDLKVIIDEPEHAIKLIQIL
jgi:hypothetical protein